MILGDPTSDGLAATTLDQMFRRAVARHPEALALIDPPNRESFTGGRPRRFTYAETDRIVSAIASRLRGLGLQTDAIVGIQLPNTVECVLTVLGVLRAGMIALPMPLLWRRADADAAFAGLSVRAIVTASRIGDFDACAMAVQLAADNFAVRQVCGFGRDLPDGAIAFDGLLDSPEDEPPAIERDGHAAAHIACVTFDVTPHGLIPVARNHAELIAGGLAVILEGSIEPDAHLLGCCATGSFAGLALTVMPWLISGGTLSLHHGFDAGAFAAQCREEGCDSVVVPGPLVPLLTEAGLLPHSGLKNLLAAWRAPERYLASPAWLHPGITMSDVLIFGETALIGSRRDAEGYPAALPAFAVTAPRGSANPVPIVEITRTGAGTLALRGPMVPRHAFPSGSRRSGAPQFKSDDEGFVDTLQACRIDRMTGTIEVSGPPPGVVDVGCYRFLLTDLDEVVRRASTSAFITALPDALTGHRLAGVSDAGSDVRATLAGIGVNPLIAGAFRLA
jgi:hypothetical protein